MSKFEVTTAIMWLLNNFGVSLHVQANIRGKARGFTNIIEAKYVYIRLEMLSSKYQSVNN